MLKDARLKYGLIGLAALAIAFGAGRLSKPSKVVTEYKDKEVIVYKETKEEKKDVKITRRRTTEPGGKVTEEEVIEDRTSTETESTASSSREVNSKSQITNTAGLTLSALVLAKDSNLNEYEFGIAVSKRIIGNISIGAIATEKRQIGLTVGIEF